jgi:hypothetical protein
MHHEARRVGKAVPLEQTPRNVFYLGEILHTYPHARVVNVIRDPRDVLLSQKLKARRFWDDPQVPKSQCVRFWANYHPVTISMLWNASVQAGDRYAKHDRVIRVRFEDLLADPEARVRSICSFLGEAYDRDMLEVTQVGSSHDRDSDETGLQGHVGQRWRRDTENRSDLAICQYVTRGNLLGHGYDLSSDLRLRPSDAIAATLTWPLKSFLALALNLSRSRSLVEAVRRRLPTRLY